VGYAKLSVIIPAYNERNTIAESVRRARDVELPIEHEIVVVDDGSTDGTTDIVRQLQDSTVRVIFQEQNRGKGEALRAGFEEAGGDLIVCHDADLEYDPRDWVAMLRPLLEGDTQVVYGSRFTGERRNMMFWHWIGNRFLSLLTNVLYNTTVSDMETCYKMVDASVLKSLKLKAKKFDIEPELTAKLLRIGQRIYEVPIRYTGRELDEGKKISWRDGIPAMWTLLRLRFVRKSSFLRTPAS
jgi:glycosyltransferase involved in cell wall biosynthesis